MPLNIKINKCVNYIVWSSVEPEVRERARDLNNRFIGMVGEMQRALQESDPGSLVSILRLPDFEFTYMPCKIIKSLEAAANSKIFFSQLSKFWDHFNYYPLEKLINGSNCCHDLKERMKCYVREMDHFRRHTDIKVYCKAVPQPEKKVPKGFREEKWKKEGLRTLHDVEVFRRKIAWKLRLRECLVFCKNIGLGSVIITLWIPLCEENSSEGVVADEVVEDSDSDDNEEFSVAPRPYSLISSVSSVVTKHVFDPFVSS